jgi:AraC-like DNA-binding protein
MGSLIRATNLRGYGDLVRELGADPVPLLARFHLLGGMAEEDEAFIPFAALTGLLEASAAELSCPDFGLRLARWQGLDILGPVAVMARNAHTLLDGLTCIARYLYVHSPALRLSVEPRTERGEVRLVYEVIEPVAAPIPQGYELAMANGASMLRLLGGLQARPHVVAFPHGQLGSDSAYAEALGCPVRFGQSWCGFDLSLSLVGRRIGTADPETRRIATEYLDSHYLPSSATLAARVAHLAGRLLPTGQCSAETIADQLAMHPRTLQRRLAAEGVSCQELVERERRDQAARYLAEPRLPLSQIAALVGYTEQSTLNRSCRRWFGKTPRQYRNDLTPSPRA